jgi:hypothetical protein
MDAILEVFYQHQAWISGSYVRERIVRKDENSPVSDVDILVEYKNLDPLLEALVEKFRASYYEIDRDEKEPLAHIDLTIGEYKFDIFSCEDHTYLSPPDLDVNTLCWTGSELVSWFDYSYFTMPYSFDLDSIRERCLQKQAIALTEEWDCDLPGFQEEINQRVQKLRDRGWSILNL